MSEPKMISPMLDNYIMGGAMSEHHGISCYPAIENESGNRYIVKVISVPASPAKLDALLLTGACPDKASAVAYFKEIADGVIDEIDTLEKLSDLEGFIAYSSHQIATKDSGDGFDIYLLGTYKKTLQKHFKRHSFTHLDALNLGLDLCSAMSVSRRLGYLYVDLKPSNIYVTDQRLFRVGDLGFMRLDSLKYASVPEKYISEYTPPEIRDAFSSLNTTMDIYAIGLILYQAYNNGELPFNADIQPGDQLPAPLYADYEMSEIILKACAPNPDDRWQEPSQLGQAIVSYMQRNGASDTPIVPMPAPVPVEEAPAEDSSNTDVAEITEDVSISETSVDTEIDIDLIPTSSVIVDEVQTEESDIINAPITEAADDTIIAETPGNVEVSEDAIVTTAEETVDDEAAGDDIIAAIVAVIESTEDAEETNTNSLSEPLPESVENAESESTTDTTNNDDIAEEAVSIEDSTGDEFEEIEDDDVPEDATLTDEVSVMLEQADVLASLEVPEPVIVPDHIELPTPEPPPEPEEEPDTQNEEEAEDASTSEATDAVEEDEAQYDESESIDEETLNEEKNGKPKRKWFLYIIAACVALALLIGGFLFYKSYYLVPVESINVVGDLDALTVYVNADIDESLLTVTCSDTYGNKLNAPVVAGKAEFSGLVPNTAYTIKVTAKGLHRLTGNSKTAYSTPVMSKVVQFDAVTGTTDNSAIISFTVEGINCEKWMLTYSADGEESRSIHTTTQLVPVSDLTVGKEYTFTLAPEDDLYVTGITTITFTPRGLIKAENLRVTSCVNNTLSVAWDAPEGETVTSWSVHCFNDEYNKTIITSETNVKFQDLDHTDSFTIEVKAAGMSVAQTTTVAANSITAENFKIDATDPTKLTFSWTTAQAIPEEGWLLYYSVSGIDNAETIPCHTNTITIAPVIPNATYNIRLEDIKGNVLLGSQNIIKTGDPVAFSKEFSNFTAQPSDLQFTIVKTPNRANWGRYDLNAGDYRSSFTSGESASYLVRFDKLYSAPDEEVTILYVYKNQNGDIIRYGVQYNNWKEMWSLTYCKLNAPALPATAGAYVMDIYFNGMLVHEQPFTIK